MAVIRCFNRKCTYWDSERPDNCSRPLMKIRECADAVVRHELKKQRSFYLKELQGNECVCGGFKKSGLSVCRECWAKLPPEMQQALYRRIGRGYEQAYEAAVEYLGVRGAA